MAESLSRAREESRKKKTGVSVVDLALDAAAGLLQRPMRALATMSGILLGLASIVATAGLAAGAAANVVASFDQYAATQVTLRARGDEVASVEGAGIDRLRGLTGVTDVGAFCSVAGPIQGGSPRVGSGASTISVVGVTPEGLSVLEPAFSSGHDVTAGDRWGESDVAVVGSAVMRSAQLADPAVGAAVQLDGRNFAVGGVVAQVNRRDRALTEVFVPMSRVRALWGGTCETWEVILATAPGAAAAVGQVAAVAATPENPRAWTVVVPPSPDALKADVETDLSALYMTLGGMSLLIGALSIANTMSIAVLERTGEIGLRRALGYTRRNVVALFGWEALMLGALGGFLAAGFGSLVVIGVSMLRQWPIVLPPEILIACPLLGMVIGFVGGIGPAIKAGRLAPAEALRA